MRWEVSPLTPVSVVQSAQYSGITTDCTILTRMRGDTSALFATTVPTIVANKDGRTPPVCPDSIVQSVVLLSAI